MLTILVVAVIGFFLLMRVVALAKPDVVETAMAASLAAAAMMPA